ncbi:GIY-YIG nuclease family protein [Actinomycetospora sp. TBRC 11914]|uniref:GIY-YIG nuclease family protein n=1 Tax=Actinomycetospora sp. TBRC 11914 TaxID=2729387 RepID=UPI00145D5C0F|nr:GIY-YIG nuclease family protein [Actinomycetospora sp. TBRC 11914]NMO93946.1 GIY-YIG nuclease family protein [Actinomycetospora sp. TBRC 11914]
MTPEEAAAALTAVPGELDATVADLPGAPGHVAWWAAPSVLPALGGAPHPSADLRLLDLGTATMLRNRVRRQDLYRTGVSRLRRVVAGLLLAELALAPTWAADVVLPKADEERLTAWLRARLALTWVPDDGREAHRARVAALLGPVGLDSPGAHEAEQRYVVAAGEKAPREVGVPFRRP